MTKQKVGGFLFFFGLGSALLHMGGYEFVLFFWINLMGEVVGWIIRIAMIIGGGLLWLIGRNNEPEY